MTDLDSLAERAAQAKAEAIRSDQAVTLDITCAPGPVAGKGSQIPVCISVFPPKGLERSPLDICCVIDISWSMSMEATVQDGSGVTESNGLSLMDVAKHAVRTVVKTLGDSDRLSVVTFCGESEIVLQLTRMDEAGKAEAETAVQAIGFGSDTRLWTGLEKGLATLQEVKEDGVDRFSHLMLLTDGEAKDKAEIMTKLRAYESQHERLPGSIYTFGVGYEIDSKLLTQVSAMAGGAYAFIPDAGLVGTIFVNTISNLMVTMARDALLTLEADSGAEIMGVTGQVDHSFSADGIMRCNLGNLQYDQSRDIVLNMTFPSGVPVKEVGSYLFASLEYTIRHKVSDARVRTQAEGIAEKCTNADAVAKLERQRCRAIFIDAIADACQEAVVNDPESIKRASGFIQAATAQLKSSPEAASPYVAALIEDVTGQSQEALSRPDWYAKWGRHYMPSIMFAHKQQQCNNFKDPGVQEYGGDLFQTQRDLADEAFCGIPAPAITPAMWRYLGSGRVIANPSYVGPAGQAYSHASNAPAAPISMAAYHNASGG